MRQVRFGGRMCSQAMGTALLLVASGCSNGTSASPTPPGDECANDGGSEDAQADTGEPLPEAGACQTLLFSEDFEASAEGAALDGSWTLVIEGPNSSARVNLDAEGHGNATSNRFALFTNAGSEPNQVEISAATAPFDVRGCTSARLTASIIVFSMEQTENDHAFVEVRGNGSDWIPMYMPFPSPDFAPDAACRAGGQETGCVAWKTVSFDVPRVALGPDTEVRFRMDALTAVTDFLGFDDVSLAGVP